MTASNRTLEIFKALLPARYAEMVAGLGLAAPLTLLSLALPPLGGAIILGTVSTVAPWLRSHEFEGMLLFVAVYAAFGGLALLPTYAASVLAGWAFGAVYGVITAMTAYLCAALLTMILVQRLTGYTLRAYIDSNPKWSAVHQALLGRGVFFSTLIITLLRLPPNAPFATLNVVCAATRVPLVPFLAGTLMGLLPRTAAVVLLGAQLESLDLSQAGSEWYAAIGLAVTVVVLLIIGRLAQAALKQVQLAGCRS